MASLTEHDTEAEEAVEEPTPEPDVRRAWLERIRARRAAILPRPVLIRLGVGLAVVSSIAILNPAFVGWGLAVTAAIVAVPLSKFRSYAVAFLPYGIVWLVFTLLRALADETPIPVRTTEVTSVERGMFFGTTPTIWLQDKLFNPLHLSWLDYLTTFTHWSYFFVPHVAAILIWRQRPELYRRFLMTMTISLGIGLFIYFVSPADPPWLTADRAPQQDIYRVMANVGRQINSSMYDRTYSVLGDPNPRAAMPSIHAAITFMLFLFALNFRRWIAVLALAYSLLMAFALVYTGEHYVIDAIIGAAISTYAYLYSGRWLQVTVPVFAMLRQPRVRAQPTARPQEVHR